MASIARLDDNVQINKFNVTTWTGDFGINKDGFPKDMYIDGSYVTLMDETPTEYPSIIDEEAVDHFDPHRLNMSGPMYLKTAQVNPAPYRMYPARKFEYPRELGYKVTWDRPGRPLQHETESETPLLTIIVLIIIALFVIKKQIKK